MTYVFIAQRKDAGPDIMWGADGARILTAEEGWCWFFGAVDHLNGEVVGHHVCKRGDRRFRLDDVMAFLTRNR